MGGFLSNLGYALIKIIVSCMFGMGVGLLIVGLTVAGDPDVFRRPQPPGGIFFAVGAGLMTTAGLLVFLFLSPWGSRRSPPAEFRPEKDLWPEERASPKTIDMTYPDATVPTKPVDDGAFESRR